MHRSVPTLADVARLASVSTATVSRCLNEKNKVSEETRRKVMSAIEELGYSPNFGARIMAARRTGTIGAVIPTMENAIFARGIEGFQHTLRRHGYTLLIASSAYQRELENEQIRALVARGAEGLLLIGHNRDPALYRFLKQQNIPALAAWTFQADGPVPSVGFDNFKAMRALASKVIGLGHRNIGVISAPVRENDRAGQRVEGIRKAMQMAGLSGQSLRIIETPYSIENGQHAFAQLMAAPDHPTAVLCGNDVLAVGALLQARAMGLDVPKDVSITGFDDIELASIVTPKLTTMHVPHQEMGERAAELLVELCTGSGMARSIELPVTFCKRQSLAAPG